MTVINNIFFTKPSSFDLSVTGLLKGTVSKIGLGDTKGLHSHFSFQYAIEAAGGHHLDFLKMNTKGERVFYINSSVPAPILKKRMFAMRAALNGDQINKASKNLSILSVYGADADLNCKDATSSLISSGKKVDLIVMDTLDGMHSFNTENLSEQRALRKTLERIAYESNAALLYLESEEDNKLNASLTGYMAIDSKDNLRYLSRSSLDKSEQVNLLRQSEQGFLVEN